MAYKISVIMPSFLGSYEGSATKKEKKFIRAVESFISQTYQNKELVIVSDGCSITEQIYAKKFKNVWNIKFVSLEKQELFSGNVRSAGYAVATGEIICFLDADDYIGITHLSCINFSFENSEYDWIYFNDYIKYNAEHSQMRNVTVEYGKIGSSSVAHYKSLGIDWEGCDGYGQDFMFVNKLRATSKVYGMAYGMSYTVCHTRGGIDL